jgi:Flp pilus assembly protein TadD
MRHSAPALVLALLAPLFLHTAWIRAGEVPSSPTQTQALEEPGETQPTLPGEDFGPDSMEEPPIPVEYLQGRGYLGNFPDAWALEKLFDPVNARVFLALQDGAGREALTKLQVPDLDHVLADLVSGRMVREESEVFQPAFPLIHGEASQAFGTAIQTAADEAYAGLRPALKKIKKAARKEKVLPWLYALVWSEVLESKVSEEALIDAGALSSQRLRDEGYLWILIPSESHSIGAERYSSGSETLHYLWTPTSYFNRALQDYRTRRRILDHALGNLPWDEEPTRGPLVEMGILDSTNHVRVPVLRKNSRLLSALRTASQAYVKDLLRTLKTEPLARALKVSREESTAAAFASTGSRVLEKAVGEGFFPRPDYLSRSDSSKAGLVEALVITEDESFDPLERAYYLYDREDFSGAIQMAEKYLQSHPGDSEALFRKGIALMKLRKYKESLEVFQQASARPVDKGDVWRGWILIREGNILDQMQRREEALKMYHEALDYADVSGSHDIARNWLEDIYRD